MRRKVLFFIVTVLISLILLAADYFEKEFADLGIRDFTLTNIAEAMIIMIMLLLISYSSRLHNLFQKKIEFKDICVGLVPTLGIIILTAMYLFDKEPIEDINIAAVIYHIFSGLIIVIFQEIYFRAIPKLLIADNNKFYVSSFVFFTLVCSLYMSLDRFINPISGYVIFAELVWNFAFTSFTYTIYLKTENILVNIIFKFINYIVLIIIPFFIDISTIVITNPIYFIIFNIVIAYLIFISIFYCKKYKLLEKENH